MTTAAKAKGPASAATDPDHGSTTPGKEMDVNSATNITPSQQVSSLRNMITEAEAIETKLQMANDDEEVIELCGKLLELNYQIIRAPVASIDDVRRKAGHLLRSGDPLDAFLIEPLLRSLVAVVPA